jgi:hypothetical protein
MLGHLMEWFYSGLGGIRPEPNSVAFHQINIRPEPVGNLKFVKASYESPYGMISSNWRKEKDRFYLKVNIPANTNATVYLPAKNGAAISENGRFIKNKTFRNGRAIVAIGSGSYLFVVN